MAKATEIVYTDEKNRPVLRGRNDRWELVGIYSTMNLADARRLHAALGELLTDVAAAGAEKEEAATA